MNRANPDLAFLGRMAGQPRERVFIVGDHRSGTTLLHRLLARTGCFNYVSAYHVIQYRDILAHHFNGTTGQAKADLARQFDALGLKDRVIDNTPAEPDSPIEYGFIISAERNLRRPFLNSDTMPVFEELCAKIQTIGDPAKPLLLKNPWDVLNFKEIHNLLPTAKFIFIQRHPAAVISSQVRAIRSMMQHRNAFAAMIAPWYAKLYDRPLQLYFTRALDRAVQLWPRLVGLHSVRAAESVVKHLPELPPESHTSIRYEQLCAEPEATMSAILKFCGVQPKEPPGWSTLIQPRSLAIPPEIGRVFQQRLKRLQPYLDRYGYATDLRSIAG